MTEIITLDIETENTGYDIMNHNKRILSVQLKDTDERIFYDGSKENDISSAKDAIRSHIKNGNKFVGFNIRNFDVPLIQKFMDVQIPSENIIEIGELDFVVQLKKRMGRNPRLVNVCEEIGIDAGHKNEMNDFAKKFIDSPEVQKSAEEGATFLHENRGWGYDFALKYSREKIAGGIAILESFKEFVDSGGSQDKLFYRYAMKDIQVESELYQKLSSDI